jgi:hypothetical protein
MLPFMLALSLAVHLGPMSRDEPAREPQLAAGRSLVALTFGAGKAIYFSASRDRGASFSPPVKVAETGILPLTRRRGPHIAIAGSAIVITAVAGKTLAQGPHAHGLPSDGDLLVWRSQDGGRTWQKGLPINDVPGSATEGLHALAGDGKNTLFAAWLDKRGGKGTALYGALSKDSGATWSRNALIYRSPGGSICECCHPSVAVKPDGEIVVMWRNSLDGARDLYLATSRDGTTFSSPRKLGDGTWQLNACPMDGGGLAVSAWRILTAWRRDADVFLAEPGQPELRLGRGKDVALALSGGRTYVAWVNGSDVEVWIDGDMERLSTGGSFPTLLSLPGGKALAAWEEGDAIQIRTLPGAAHGN